MTERVVKDEFGKVGGLRSCRTLEPWEGLVGEG